MNLADIAKAVAVVSQNHAILLYGPPKGGKTRLVGTAAKLPEVRRIFWFDIENGIETLLSMGLTEEEMQKIIVIKIRDTRDNPIAIETMLKALTSKKPVSICEMHGVVDCAECKKSGSPSISWCLSDCTHNDLVVIDSGSQMGDSALAAACLGKPHMYKPTFDEYGMVNKWLGDITSVIQQCVNTNFVVITHEIALEDDEGKDRIFPLMGSKQFSMKCAKFFGTVVYVHKKMNKHVAGSSSTYRVDVLTGSRIGAKIEDDKDMTMHSILVKGGVLKASDGEVIDVPATEVSDPTPTRPLTLKEKLALKTHIHTTHSFT
ncbi:MAG: AAA family ATPase [Candidatus Babeliales bacterium]